MSGGFPLFGEVCNHNVANPSPDGVYAGTPVVQGGPNVLGSYTQLIASTPADTCLVLVYIVGDISGPNTDMAIDIAIGPSGSEVVIFPSLRVASGGGPQTCEYYFPCSIPAGTRIAARAQQNGSANDGSHYAYVALRLFDGSFDAPAAAGADVIGYDSTTTQGTGLIVSGDGPKGAYSQLTASTSRDYVGFAFSFDWQGGGDYGYYYFIDVAIGPSGSEVIIFPDYALQVNNNPVSQFIPQPIPAGSRISARTSVDYASGAGDTLGITLYGVYK